MEFKNEISQKINKIKKKIIAEMKYFLIFDNSFKIKPNKYTKKYFYDNNKYITKCVFIG